MIRSNNDGASMYCIEFPRKLFFFEFGLMWSSQYYSREETIEERKLFPEIRYLIPTGMENTRNLRFKALG